MIDYIGLVGFLTWEIMFIHGGPDLKDNVEWVDQLVYFSFGTFQLIWYSFYLIITFKFYIVIERYNTTILMLEGREKTTLRLLNIICFFIMLLGTTHFFLCNAIIAFIYSFKPTYNSSERMQLAFRVLEWF